MIRLLLILILATSAGAADFLNLHTGRFYNIPDTDTGTLADFRSAASARVGCGCLPEDPVDRCALVPGIACGNVEVLADVPAEAFKTGLSIDSDGRRSYGGYAIVDLDVARDGGQPPFRWDGINGTVKPRRLADLTTYRTTRELQVRAGKLAAVVEADAKLAALTELEKAPPAGATPEALALVRQQMEADRASMAADLAR